MTYGEYLEKIDTEEKRTIVNDLVNWTLVNFKDLKLEMKWNQPMFTKEGTFIIAFSALKNHISVAPEKLILDQFLDEITELGYKYSKMIFKIKYTDNIDHVLLHNIIQKCIEVKKDYTQFWL